MSHRPSNRYTLWYKRDFIDQYNLDEIYGDHYKKWSPIMFAIAELTINDPPEWMKGATSITTLPRYVVNIKKEFHKIEVSTKSPKEMSGAENNENIARAIIWVQENTKHKWGLYEGLLRFENKHEREHYRLIRE